MWGSSHFTAWIFIRRWHERTITKNNKFALALIYQTFFFKSHTSKKNLWKEKHQANNNNMETFVCFFFGPQVPMLPPSEVANQMSSPLAPMMASWDCGASRAAKPRKGKKWCDRLGKDAGYKSGRGGGTNLDVSSWCWLNPDRNGETHICPYILYIYMYTHNIYAYIWCKSLWVLAPEKLTSTKECSLPTIM